MRRPSDGCLWDRLPNHEGVPSRYTVVCDDEVAREVETLAQEYDLTEEEVLRQLLDLGMEHLD